MNKFLVKNLLLIIVYGIMYQCQRTPPSIQIDADFAGGNIIVMNINGDTVHLQQDPSSAANEHS